MRRAKSQSKKAIVAVYVIFGAFFLYQLLQHSFVFLYHDDYGYASLQYSVAVGHGGMEYSFGDILQYLGLHYMNWGGRILYFFLEILLLRIGGLTLIRAAQAAVITVITYETYRLAKGSRSDYWVMALASALLWGTMMIKTLREGVYWFTASVLYVWPLAFFMAGILVDKSQKSANKRGLRNWLVFFLFFVAAFSQEQVAGMVIVYCALEFLFCQFKRRKKHFFPLAGAALGGALEIFAPGNFVRTEVNASFFELPLFDKLTMNIPKLLSILFGPQNIFFVILCSFALVLSVCMIWKGIDNKAILIGYLLLGGSYPAACGIDRFLYPLGIWLYAFIPVWSAAVFLWLLWYLLRRRQFTLFSILLAGICSQLALLISPSLSQRTAALFQLIFHVTALYIFGEACLLLRGRDGYHIYFTLASAVTALACLWNAAGIGLGYYRNARINIENNIILEEAARDTREGVTVDNIVLYKMYDDNYAEDMPYQKSYIEFWMKQYYGIAPEVVFTYEEAWKSIR